MGSTMIMLVLIVVAVIAFFVFRKKDNIGSNKQMKNTDGVKEKEVVKNLSISDHYPVMIELDL